MNTAAGPGPHWGSPSNHHIIPNDNISVQCTMSQAPLSLVEFKTWPLSLTTSATGLQSTGNNDDCHTADHQSVGGGAASNFCGLMPIPSFAMRFFKDFQRFCPLLPDLVLQLDSGERVNVHRVLFYCCSAYCRQKLKAQQVPLEKDCWSSSRTNGVSLMHQQIPSSNKFSEFNTCPTSEISLIRVPRVEYDSLRTVVDFVYSGGLIDRVNIESLPKIRFAATLLGIDELVTVCDSIFRLYQQGHRGITVNNHMNPASTDFTDHHNHLDSFSSCAPSRNDELCMSPTGRATVDRLNSMSSTPAATISSCSSTNQFKTTPTPTQHYLCIKQQQKHQQQRLPSVASVLAEISSDNRLKLIGNSRTGTSDDSAVYTHIEIKREDDCNTIQSSSHNEPRKAATSKRCNCNNKSSSRRSHTSSAVISPNSLLEDSSNMVPTSSATTKNISSNRFICIIEYMKEDLVMTEKYIYASRLQNFNSLLSTYNVIQCIDNNSMNKAKTISSQKDSTYGSSSCVQQKHRHSLILFSLLAANDNHSATASHQKSLQSSVVQHGQVGKMRDCRQPSLDSPSQSSSTSTTPLSATESQLTAIDSGDSLRVQILSNTIEANLTTTSKGVQRFALLCHLDFSDKNSLYTCCHHVLSNSIKELMHFDRKSDLNLRLDSVFCLKKSSGFKSSFRRETLLTTSECYKALAEYSRPEVGELPLVLLSCNGMLHID